MRFSEMIRMKGSVARSNRVLFNCPQGNVGLKAVDGVNALDRIRFLPADEFDYPRSSIKASSRLMTYVNIPELDTEQRVAQFCGRANQILKCTERCPMASFYLVLRATIRMEKDAEGWITN